jgi:hypothetical protein
MNGRARVTAVAVVAVSALAGTTVAGAQAASGRHEDRTRARNVICTCSATAWGAPT